MIDWICYHIAVRLPLHRFRAESRFIEFILPRAGRHAKL